MKKYLFLLSLVISASLYAEDFKILFLNTESIKIGSTTYTVGDVFSDTEKIHWKNGKQAMKVLSLETNKQYVLVSEDFKQRKLKSAKDYLVKNNRLSTRGIGSFSSVAASLGDRCYWLDPTFISVDYEPDDGEFFYLKSEESVVPLMYSDGQLVLDSRIWGENKPHQTVVDVMFRFFDGIDELVCPDYLIIPVETQIGKGKISR